MKFSRRGSVVPSVMSPGLVSQVLIQSGLRASCLLCSESPEVIIGVESRLLYEERGHLTEGPTRPTIVLQQYRFLNQTGGPEYQRSVSEHKVETDHSNEQEYLKCSQ
jgi:hypothetical protein